MGKGEKKKEIGFDGVGIEAEGDVPVLLTFLCEDYTGTRERDTQTPESI